MGAGCPTVVPDKEVELVSVNCELEAGRPGATIEELDVIVLVKVSWFAGLGAAVCIVDALKLEEVVCVVTLLDASLVLDYHTLQNGNVLTRLSTLPSHCVLDVTFLVARVSEVCSIDLQ